MELLKAAIKGNYDYYHLISGMDLPIKTQKEIHEFFENNKGKEFIQENDANIIGFIKKNWEMWQRQEFSKKYVINCDC